MKAINLRPWQQGMCEWNLWVPEHGETEDDARTVRALSAERAAEDYAEWSDCQGDYTVISGTPVTVLVRCSDDSCVGVQKFEVRGESVPHYIALECPL